jgi:ribose transport system permease protein
VRSQTFTDRLSKAAGSGVIVWLVVVILLAIALTFSSGFATPNNLNSVSRQGALLALVALGQFLVVLLGHVDLAIAANAKLAALFAAIVMNGSDSGLLPGVLVAIAVGLVVGAVNAFLVVGLKVESFIATLGTGTILQGIALFIAPTPVGKSAPALDAFYEARVGGGPYVIVIVIVAFWVLAWFVLTKTVLGRHIFATGGNSDVAALSGVSVKPIHTSVFLASGLLGGLAGVFLIATSGFGDPSAATGLEFTALAVVVIGGASLDGGRGRLIGLLGGVVLFAILGNIFNLLRIEVWYQQLLRGLIILIAAALFANGVRRVRRAKKSRAAPLTSEP